MQRTISESIDRYLSLRQYAGNISRRTIESWRHSLARFVKATGIQYVKEVSQELVEDYLLETKMKRQWTAKTLRNELGYLRVFFKWCIERGYLDQNPTSAIPSPRIPKSLPKSMSLAEAERLLDIARCYKYKYPFERNRAMAILSIFVFAGLRKSELLNLKMVDVDLEAMSIFVRSGKGEKDRFVPIAPGLVHHLKRYIADREQLGRNCPYFFVTLRTDSRLGERAIRRLVEKIRAASGIYFYPHMLRHTFATLMLDGGVNLFDLSKMMGHSDIKTTTIYLSTSVERLKEQIVKHPMNF